MNNYKNIIINADDFGMSTQIDQAIIKAIRANYVNSISVSVVHDRIFEAISLLKPFLNKIAIGLHVNLTEGKPVELNYNDSLVIKENFHSAIKSLMHEKVHCSSRIKVEIQAQLNRFKKLLGFYPHHIDSHQHFTYLSPKAFLAFTQVAFHSKIKIRSAAPFTDKNRLSLFIASVKSRFGIEIPLIPEQHAKTIISINESIPALWRTNDCQIDNHDDVSTIRMNALSQNITDNLEIICHPR